MGRRIGLLVVLVVALGVAVLTSDALAVAPSPEALAKWKAEGVLDERLASWRAFLANGGCSPSTHPIWDKSKYAQLAAANPNAVDTHYVLVLLVQFSDNHFTSPAGGINYAIDSILFSDKQAGGPINPSGSMIDYYREVSYGKLHLIGGVYGPYTAPQPYSYYVGTDNGFSKSPELVQATLTEAENDVPWAEYAEPGTHIIPNVIVVHAGTGAEGSGGGIWSHKSSVGAFSLQGYSFTDYNMDPELGAPGMLSAIGVFCHEYGHTLGLPDLYDTQYHAGSEGLGNWSLMASGNYNGNSQYPAHLDPWCKLQLGFIPVDSVRLISANQYNVPIPAVEYNQAVYEIPDSTWTDPGNPSIRYYSSEYFLVENRQRVGSDQGLPGPGLVIYHVDNTASNNNNPARYKVAVVQGDGLNSMNYGGSRGDAGDPYPGTSNNRNLDNFSNPDTRRNVTDSVTQIAVWNISNSDSVMYANMDYNYSHPKLSLTGTDSLSFLDTAAGNVHDSAIGAGETITFYCRAINRMRPAYNWSVQLACDDPDITFIKNNVAQGSNNLFNPLLGARKSDSAVVFQLAPNAQGRLANFTLTIRADSVFQSGDRAYSQTFQFKKLVGSPQLLLVDDDNGQNLEQTYIGMCERLGLPYRLWDRSGGTPSAATMIANKNVFWIQGTPPTGGFNASDIAQLKTFLDNGGHFAALSSVAAPQIQLLDTAFLHNYLHAQAADSVVEAAVYFIGNNSNPVADSSKYKVDGNAPVEVYTLMNLTPVNGGQPAFYSTYSVSGLPNQGNCGVTYNGTSKTVLCSFPLEWMSATDSAGGYFPPDSLMMRIMEFFGGNATGIDDHGGNSLPQSFALLQNYPNPFNPSTVIAYTIPAMTGTARSVHTVLEIYNMLGQRVRTLVNTDQAPGDYKVTWNGTSDAGTRVSSGIYLYRLSRGDYAATRKMVLLK